MHPSPARSIVQGVRAGPRKPIWIDAGASPYFPSPEDFDAHGLVAGGGDLSPARLLAAYAAGIFPWYDEPPILWWSPDPRGVLELEHLHVSRSLRRLLAKGVLRITVDQDLLGVLDGCADRPEGTWLGAEMRAAYQKLAIRGVVKSYEVWEGSTLVGGLYGVLHGALFAAESMFHRRTDASKVALVSAVLHTFAAGARLFDVQFVTRHLARMGARELPRSEYLKRVSESVTMRTHWPEGADASNLAPWVVKQLGAALARQLPTMVPSASDVAERG